MICPPEHQHAATTTCRKNHKCDCEPCVTTQRNRSTTNQRNRRRLEAYGRHETMIPATGTIRRIQGLQFLGWPLDIIGAEAGVSGTAIGLTLTREQVEPATRDRITEVFVKLIARGKGPSTITAKRARAKGWVSPYAWDDIDTDVTPADVTGVHVGVDDVRVWRAVNGPARKHKLTAQERREAVRLLHARRWSDQKIANQLGCDQQTVFRARDILGLPAYAYHELVKETA